MSPHYDFADIRDVYPESTCQLYLKQFATERDKLDAFYLRAKWKNSKEWMASLSGNMRGNFNRCVRRMQEKGEVKFELYKDGPVPKNIIDDMVRLKKAWCIANGKTGMFDNPAMLEFFHATSNAAAAKGRLFLTWLTCGAATAAYQQGFLFKGTIYAVFWAHHEEWAQLSPGNVIMMNTIGWALDNDYSSIDYGQGDSSNPDSGESHFKIKYSNEILKCSEFTFSGRLRGKILERLYFGLRTLVRRIKSKGA